MPLVIERLERASLLPGATRVDDQNQSEVWKATLQAESGQTIGFLKLLPANQLISEIACALIGRVLGLDIPKPFLVSVRRTELQASKNWMDTGTLSECHRIAFALEDGGHPSLRKRFNTELNKDPAKVMAVINRWKDIKAVAFFDEWVANIDRNIGNFLYDGADRFILIDHGHAFTGEKWKPTDLQAERSVKNLLLEQMAAALGKIRPGLLGKLSPDWSRDCARNLAQGARPDGG